MSTCSSALKCIVYLMHVTQYAADCHVKHRQCSSGKNGHVSVHKLVFGNSRYCVPMPVLRKGRPLDRHIQEDKQLPTFVNKHGQSCCLPWRVIVCAAIQRLCGAKEPFYLLVNNNSLILTLSPSTRSPWKSHSNSFTRPLDVHMTMISAHHMAGA